MRHCHALYHPCPQKWFDQQQNKNTAYGTDDQQILRYRRQTVPNWHFPPYSVQHAVFSVLYYGPYGKIVLGRQLNCSSHPQKSHIVPSLKISCFFVWGRHLWLFEYYSLKGNSLKTVFLLWDSFLGETGSFFNFEDNFWVIFMCFG